jgi:hypothetical protein
MWKAVLRNIANNIAAKGTRRNRMEVFAGKSAVKVGK